MNTAVVKPISTNRSSTPVRVFFVIMCVAMLIVASCGDDDGGPSSNDKPACQLAKQTSTTNGQYSGAVTYTSTYTVTYGYDNAGNLEEQNASYSYNYSDGKTAVSMSSYNYQFDDKGFLVRELNQYNGTDRDGQTYIQTVSRDYTYENERLVKEVTASTNNGVAQNYSQQYSYDADGRLTKYTTTYDNSSITIEYSGKTISKLTRTDAGGNSTSPFLQYNDKGLLIKSIETDGGYTEEYRYEYTSEGLVAREERWLNGKRSSAYTYEYDAKENPFAYIYAERKGIPKIPSTRADFVDKRNYTKNVYFDTTDDGSDWKAGSTSVYIYDYNDRGFPTGYTSRSVDGTGKETNTSTTTYEYSNCQ